MPTSMTLETEKPGTATAAQDANRIAHLLDLRSIAVIGASEDQTKFGGRLFKNLLRHGFEGDIYPINANRPELFGVKTYPDLKSLPGALDAFVMALPANMVKDQVIAAAEMGAKLGIIISSGFSDAGDEGRKLEQELVEIARGAGMRLIGPNCLGVISPEKGITLCSSPILDRETLPKLPVGFVSQSGALMTTAFDKAWSTGGGFTHGFSVGNQADLEVCDFIDFLVSDSATRVICAYIEGVKDSERFLRSARAAREAGKPLLVVKAGRSQAGQQAAFSHTASVAGDAAVFAAVCREQGALVLDDINSMLLVAQYLATQPHRPLGNTAIVTPSGGGGALAADAMSHAGLPLAQFGEEARAILREFYPEDQIKNPLDFGTRRGRDEQASAAATAKAVQQEPDVDSVLCVTAMAPLPWQMQVVEGQAREAANWKKPIMVAIDAGHTSDPVRARLAELQIPYANSTEDAVKTLVHVRQWQQLRVFPPATRPAECPAVPHVFKPGQYDEHQTKAMLSAYGIPTNQGVVATTEDEAAKAAERIGFPVVLKVVSPDIVHKSDVGGVVVGLSSVAAVREAYRNMLQGIATRVPGARIEGILVQKMVKGDLELIVGGRTDEAFGPVIVFGAGGVLVELLPDKFLATAPITREAVYAGLESLSIWKILKGYRGKTLAVDPLVDIVVRLSWMMHDLKGHDFELDLNPVLVGADHATAVDARLLIN